MPARSSIMAVRSTLPHPPRRSARAIGAAYATARAFVFEGVAQYASASGTFTTPTSPATDADIVTVGGAALASLTNGATINVGANATATGTISANAYATVGFGVGQLAHASGGTASDHVYNSGTITVAANANAAGGPAVNARAQVGAGIVQYATANPVGTSFTATPYGSAPLPGLPVWRTFR